MKNLSDKMSEEYQQEVLEKLTKILISQDQWVKEGIKNGRLITKDTRLLEDLGMDSLDSYEYASEVMEKFKGLYIPDEKIIELETIGDYMNEISLIDCTSNKI
jgi:acyl carrier protein